MSKKLTKLLLVALVTVVLFALASFNAFASTYTDDGTGMDDVIANAVTDAANEDVTITLNGTWTFTADTVFGDPEAIPSHTITVNGGENAEIHTDGYMPSFCGHFVFNNIKFVGAPGSYVDKGETKTRWDGKNGLYFPEGASCVIGTGCDGYASHTTTECGANLAGDSIEVNSGKFAIVCAQMLNNANTVLITDPHITVQGDAQVITVCGLGYNRGDINGKAHLTVGGSASVTEFLVAGGYYSASSVRGGDLTVATTGNSTVRNICCFVGGSGAESEGVTRPTYNLNITSTATLTVTNGISVSVQNGNMSKYAYADTNMYVGDGVRITNDWYSGFLPGNGGGSNFRILAGGNNTVTLDGVQFATNGKSFYGGSKIVSTADKGASVDATNIDVTVTDKYTRKGTAFLFNGYLVTGSNFVATSENGTHSGTTTLHLNGAVDYNSYGGSNIQGINAKQTGDSCVYLGKTGIKEAVYNYKNVYGGACIAGTTAEFQANSALVIENVDYYGGSLFAGSLFNAASHSEDSVGGRHVGDSTLTMKSGTLRHTTKTSSGFTVTNVVALLSGGCSGYQTVAYDSDADDKIDGGFSQVGNVYVNIEGGTLRGKASFAGYGVNVDGSVTVNVTGGKIQYFSQVDLNSEKTGTKTTVKYPSFLCLEASSSTWHNTVSITGDMKIYLRGGDFSSAARLRLCTYGTSGTPTLSPSNGHAVVKGNVYWEITGGNFAGCRFTFGADSAIGDLYVKIAGDTVDMSSAGEMMNVNVSSTYHANTKNKRTLDLSQLNNAGSYAFFTKDWNHANNPVAMYTNTGAFTTVIPALMDINTATITGATYAAGADPLAGTTLSFAFNTAVQHSGKYNTAEGFQSTDTYNKTYDEFIAWDEYASEGYKNADLFTLSESKLGKFTTSVDVSIAGKDATLEYTNPNIASVTSATNDEFGYLGISLRPADSAIRVRAYVNETLRNRNLTDDGYVAVEYGVLLSKTVESGLTYGAAKVSKAIAFDSSNDTFFVEDGKYTFAAALYNIKSGSYDTDVSFRPYIVLEDANGEQLVIYADMTGVTNFLNVDTIRTNLREVATYVRDNQVDFYNQNKKKIDAIIAG